MKYLAFFFLFFTGENAYSRTVEYRPGSKTGIEFVIPYGPFSLATHKGKGELDRAALFIDSENLQNTTGEFSVLLSGLATENSERDCHMRETLGLNYALSDFPKKHVCNENYELPASGKNAVVFPEILFRILSVKNITQSEQEATFEVEGQWTIHGVSKKQVIAVKLMPDKDKMRVTASAHFFLKDFDLQVKPVKILFFSLDVKDPIKVDIDLLLESYPPV